MKLFWSLGLLCTNSISLFLALVIEYISRKRETASVYRVAILFIISCYSISVFFICVVFWAGPIYHEGGPLGFAILSFIGSVCVPASFVWKSPSDQSHCYTVHEEFYRIAIIAAFLGITLMQMLVNPESPESFFIGLSVLPSFVSYILTLKVDHPGPSMDWMMTNCVVKWFTKDWIATYHLLMERTPWRNPESNTEELLEVE